MDPKFAQTTIKLSITTQLLATAALTCRASGYTLDRLLAKALREVSSVWGVYDPDLLTITDDWMTDFLMVFAILSDKNFEISWTVRGVEYKQLSEEGRSALHDYCCDNDISINDGLYFINECLLSLDVRDLYVQNKIMEAE